MEQQGSSFLLDPWYNRVWWNHCGHICWNLPSFQICFKRLNLSVFKGHDYFSSPSLVPGMAIRHQSSILDPPRPEYCSQLLSPCACLVGQPLGTVLTYIREFERKCLHLSLGSGEKRHSSSSSGYLIFLVDALEDASFCHCSVFWGFRWLLWPCKDWEILQWEIWGSKGLCLKRILPLAVVLLEKVQRRKKRRKKLNTNPSLKFIKTASLLFFFLINISHSPFLYV